MGWRYSAVSVDDSKAAMELSDLSFFWASPALVKAHTISIAGCCLRQPVSPRIDLIQLIPHPTDER